MSSLIHKLLHQSASELGYPSESEADLALAGFLFRDGIEHGDIVNALRWRRANGDGNPKSDQYFERTAEKAQDSAPPRNNGKDRAAVELIPRSNGKGRAAADLDLNRLLQDVCGALSKYVIFASESQKITVALWIALTHVFQQFEILIYLAITSAEMRSGKTLLCDLLELLVARPWRAVLPSEAVVYRKIAAAEPTLILDEVDAIYGPAARDHEGLRALLNAGHRRGATVPRCVGPNMAVVDFQVFCPKALAGIGDLPDTVADRSVPIRLRRRKRTEKVSRFRFATARDETGPVREQLEVWAAEVDLRSAQPDVPEELGDRAADGWEPLLSIADAAGGEWPALARQAARSLHEADEDSETLGVRLLGDLKTVFDRRGDPSLFTATLLEDLHEMDTAPWGELRLHRRDEAKPLNARGLARLLKPYGVRSGSVRDGDDTGKGYTRASLEDAWDRYVPVETPSERSQGHNPAESGTCDDFQW